ncbi:sialate O-acetylesterase [Mucilaginibacter gotjawali]|uniref:Sialate O-acetylesterase n=1 Tax=Mucilaginibacter gotjawali TaxID=1550579 RepID=A0A839SBL7_9SPHI|nr:sialate O-acetylesterase [Mucilaginibacter gotjawali]MBB3054724.1 sialate O-acetylesterase [Mucilaginibacter gotjawali]
MIVKKHWLYPVLALLVLAGCRKDLKVVPVTDKGTLATTLSVSSLFQNNMVVQRDKPTNIWGQAPAHTQVTVNVSWSPAAIITSSDALGNWKVTVSAAAANTSAQNITIKAPGNSTIIISNVLIGDVWICSGQSNMVMPVDTMAPFKGVLNYVSEIAAANYPMIRMLTVQEDIEPSPIASLNKPVSWSVCSPVTVGRTSAVAYYFARKLTTTLNVPIGIIVSAVNGSYCQDWANVEAIENDPNVANNYLAGSSGLYNGMINPLINLSIKGFAWYQGENNQGDPSLPAYTQLNADLVKGWRTKFNQPELPFYYVQLTPFAADYNSTTPPGGNPLSDYLAYFREAQSNMRPLLANTGMAVTMDVGDPANHHPPNKEPVGERLALLALNYTYGQSVPCLGPQYASFSANQATVTINFVQGTANGLTAGGNVALKQYFFVAGPDHVFRQGQAAISGNTIVITAPPGTPLPVKAVRYAFTNAPVTDLQNSAGLPAEPFRTDNWSN